LALFRRDVGRNADGSHDLGLLAFAAGRFGNDLHQRDGSVGPDQRIGSRPDGFRGADLPRGGLLPRRLQPIPLQHAPVVEVDEEHTAVAGQQMGNQRLPVVQARFDAQGSHVLGGDGRRQPRLGDHANPRGLKQRQRRPDNQHEDRQDAEDDARPAERHNPAGGLVASFDSPQRGFAKFKHSDSSASPRRQGFIPMP
jgi:hypothetical protein